MGISDKELWPTGYASSEPDTMNSLHERVQAAIAEFSLLSLEKIKLSGLLI